MRKEDFFNADRSDREHIQGVVERIVFRSEETGFTVLRLVLDHHLEQSTTVVGLFPFVNKGEHVRFFGNWKKDPKYGAQFQAERYETILPVTEKGIEKYLGSGLVEGIGEKFARRIVAKFGRDTLKIIQTEPRRLLEVEGIGEKRFYQILQAWKEQNILRDVIIFLGQYNVGPALATKIVKSYGGQALDIIQTNPYKLADDIRGIGFLTADKIARHMGVAPEEPARIESGLKYSLQKGTEEGHTYLPREELVRRSGEILRVSATLIEDVLDKLLAVNHLTEENQRIYFPSFYRAEKELAHKIVALTQAKIKMPDPKEVQRRVEQLSYLQKISYTAEQKQAISLAMQEKILVLTGGPGTGKTTTVRGIIQLFDAYRMKVKLCAPTGRAAKRLTEATSREAKTIHRLLKFDPKLGQFYHNEDHPLALDVLIVDEFSMVDIFLAFYLLKALPLGAKLILVGDVDQLPSVGPGNVLRDLIDSRTVGTVHLKKVFRQALNSQIIVNAHRINRGLLPEIKRKPGVGNLPAGTKLKPIDDFGDFLFVQEDDPEQTAHMILELVTDKLPKRYGYDPLRDIEVLTPMYRGPIGVDRLNRLLQAKLNPRAKTKEKGKLVFARGDKVMQMRNNYEKGVYNGDIGLIAGIDPEERKFWVDFDSRVAYDFSEADQLVLAYAITIHKSQGSEYPVIICPITTHHYIMLQRNLIYTAITRAEELVVLIGTRKALSIAVNNNRVQQRFTGLRDFLRQAFQTKEHG